MEGYEQYRMTDWGWVDLYQKKMGLEQFRNYRDEVYAFLFRMKPGDILDIENRVKTENIELFVKIVCSFITEGNYNYDFTNDYKKVRCHAKGNLDICRQRVSAEKLGKIDSQANCRTNMQNGECSEPVHTSKTIDPSR